MESTPKNMALQLGALITLIVSISSLLVLLFSVINLAFPDAADSYWSYESAQDSIRYAIASLVVFFPTYLTLTRKVNVARRHESGLYHTLTKWLVYAALLVGGLVILGDLVAIIMAFLNGELTTRFLLKAGSLLVVVGAAFWYYQRDAVGYWNSHEKESVRIGIVAALLVAAAVVYGYLQIDAPSEVRERGIDQEQVNDLSDMQWRIEDYYRANEVLPEDLETLYAGLEISTAPEEREPYEYKVTSETTYELCATFKTVSQERYDAYRAVPTKDYSPANFNWEHQAERKCFERALTSLER